MVGCARLQEATVRGAITWRFESAQRPAQRVGSIRADEHDIARVFWVDHAQHEDLALEPGDAARREVDYGEYGAADERLGSVPARELRARAQLTDRLAKVDPEFQSRFFCLREQFTTRDAPWADIEGFECGERRL